MEELGMINLNDGGKIQKVAFGTGTTFTNRTDDVFDGILKAFNAGYRLFDTAMVYGTETGVGKAVRKLLDEGLCKREDVFITTKIPPIFGKFEDVCIKLIIKYLNWMYKSDTIIILNLVLKLIINYF